MKNSGEIYRLAESRLCTPLNRIVAIKNFCFSQHCTGEAQ